MDELELFKRAWKIQETKYPKFSYNEIYKMILKRSTSIVKWIFVFSIIELLIGIISFILTKNEIFQQMESFNLKNFYIATQLITLPITIYFIYCFYQNFRRISATDNAVTLMKNILRTRKIVKYYISFVLTSITLISVIILFMVVSNHAASADVIDTTKYTFTFYQWLAFIGVFILFLIILLGLTLLLYSITYGLLLRKLRKNYRTLKDM